MWTNSNAVFEWYSKLCTQLACELVFVLKASIDDIQRTIFSRDGIASSISIIVCLNFQYNILSRQFGNYIVPVLPGREQSCRTSLDVNKCLDENHIKRT